MNSKSRPGILTIFILFPILLSAQTWTGGGDPTNWNDPANWSTNPSLPTNGSNILIDASSVTLSTASLFSPADIGIVNGGSLDITTGGSIIADDDISITGSTSSLTVSGGAIRGSDNLLVTDGTITISGGELELAGRLTFSGGALDIQGGLLDLNGSGSSDDLTLIGSTFTMSGGALENNRGVNATNGSFTISGGTLDQNGSGSSDDMIFSGTTITISGGTVNNDRELFVNDGSLDIQASGTLNMADNLEFTGSATGNLSGTVDLSTSGDLILSGSSVVNIYTNSLVMDDLVLNDDGQSSTVNVYGTLTAFDDLKFDENPPDDVTGDNDQVIVRDGGTLTITDNFRDADLVESGNNIHVESGGAADIGGIVGLTSEEAYGSLLTSDEGANLTVGGGDPLPVELIGFEAVSSKEHVKLEWSTAVEINNAYFDLFKSTDGENFSAVARVGGSGNSDKIVVYSYIDQWVVPGVYYYQLKQVDFDGESEYHQIIDVAVEGSLSIDNSISAFPNPVSLDDFTITTSNVLTHPRLRIYTLSGKLIVERSLESATNWTLNKSDLNLSKGTYIFKINDMLTGSPIGSIKISIAD